MKAVEIVFLVILFLYELIFPFHYYNPKVITHQDKFVYNPRIENLTVSDTLYERSYLMPNGKYVQDRDTSYEIGLIPINVQKIAKDKSIKYKMDNNNLLAEWIILSNWGLYSYGNNPFGIEYSDVKRILPTFPATSVVLSKKFKYVEKADSSYYKLLFVKIASFNNIDESFDIYCQLLTGNIIRESEFQNLEVSKVKNYLTGNIKIYKSSIDSQKISLFSRDTISLNDTTFVISKKDETIYKRGYMPNILLLLFTLFLFLKYKKD